MASKPFWHLSKYCFFRCSCCLTLPPIVNELRGGEGRHCCHRILLCTVSTHPTLPWCQPPPSPLPPQHCYKPNLFHRDRQNSTEIFVWPLLMQCILAIAVCWHCLMLSEQVSTDADVRISGWIPAISKTLSNCLAQEHLHYITWYTDTNTILTLKNMMNDQMNTNDLEKQ